MLGGFCGAPWWETLQPEALKDEGKGWGAAYGGEFRTAMIAQSAEMARLLRIAFTLPDERVEQQQQQGGGEIEEKGEDREKGEKGEGEREASELGSPPLPPSWHGWLTTEGFGWAVGIVRLNGQVDLRTHSTP